MSLPQESLPLSTREFYVKAMRTLVGADIPFLVGGAYALRPFAGIERHTKDLDLFLRPADLDRALEAFEQAGFRTERTFPHWLAKVYGADGNTQRFVDVIYSSGNGLTMVDDAWFEHAPEADVLGLNVRLTPPEESLWSKAFVMERERFDGADVAHLIRAIGPDLDWDRLVQRFGPHWRVLMAHLVLFGYIYPAERDKVPARVLRLLADRLRSEIETPAEGDPVCQGTLLSRAQYLTDLHRDGLADGRVEPRGTMTPDDVEHWTAAISEGGASPQARG